MGPWRHHGRRAAVHAGAAAVLAVGLSACVTRPTPRISAVTMAARLDARALADPGLRRFIAHERGDGPIGWDLDRLTLAALYDHPDVALADARLAAARAAIVTARARPNPNLSLIPQADPIHAGAWTVGAAIGFLIETGGKRSARVAEADALAEAAREDLDAAAWPVRARVRSALLDLWIGQRRQRLAGRRFAAEGALVALLDQRAAQGAASAIDVARERASLDAAELALRDADKAEAVARARLAGAIGVPAAALNGVPLIFAGLDTEGPAGGLAALRESALTRRADVRAAVARYDAAQAAVRLQLANRVPNVSVAPSYNDQGDREPSAPVSFDLPILNQNQGPIAEAVARRRTAAAELEAVQARIAATFDTAAAVLARAQADLIAADQLVSAERGLQAREGKLFDSGETDRPSLVAGEATLIAAETARLDALAAERQALGQLEDAAQQPLFGGARIFVPPLGRPFAEEGAPQ